MSPDVTETEDVLSMVKTKGWNGHAHLLALVKDLGTNVRQRGRVRHKVNILMTRVLEEGKVKADGRR